MKTVPFLKSLQNQRLIERLLRFHAEQGHEFNAVTAAHE